MTDNVELGLGLSATPNIHVGQEKGSKAFAQTSTGAILEIDQPTMPLKNSKTGRVAWEEP
jgi:type IV pilus assembly protein PilY1